MRILTIDGEDYAVLNFEGKHGNVNATEVMNNLSKYESEDEEWELSVTEVDGEASPEFVVVVKNFIDHDDKKHRNFYIENEIIK